MGNSEKSSIFIIFTIILTAALFFSPFATEPFRDAKECMFYLLLAISMFLYLSRFISTGEFVIRKNPITIPILVFLGYSGLSILWADDRYLAVKASFNIFPAVIFFFLINNIKVNKKILEKILTLIFICGLLSSIYGLIQNFDIDPLFQRKVNILDYDQALSRSKITAFTGNPNLLSDFLVLCLPALLILLLSSKSLIKQIVIILFSAVIISNIYLAQSRNSFFAVILGFVFFCTFLFYKRKEVFLKQKRNVVILLILIIIMMEFLYLIPGLKERIKHESDTIKQRKAIWKTTMNMIIDKPFVGWGIGCFKSIFYDYHIKRMIQENYNYDYTPSSDSVHQAHNEYLQILSELGIPGLLITFWILIAFIKHLLGDMKIKDDYYSDLVKISCITSVLMSCLLSLASFPFHFVPTGILPLLYVGLATKQNNDSSQEYVYIRIQSAKGVLYIFILFSLGLSLLLATIFITVSGYYAKAGNNDFLEGKLEGSIGFYKKALFLNPFEGEYYFKYSNILASKGDYNLALKYFHKARKNFLAPELDINIGLCYENLNQKKVALYYYENAVIFSNFFVNIRYKIGKMFLDMGNEALDEGDIFGALHLYMKSKRYFPDNSDVYIKIGDLYDLMGDKDKKLSYLEFALSFNTRNTNVLESLGNLYFDNKDYMSAFKYYMRLRYLLPENNRIISLINKKYDLVLKEYRDKDPYDGFWDFQLFLISQKGQEKGKSYQYLESAIKKEIKTGYVYFLYGNKQFEASNFISAVKMNKAAIFYDPTLIDAYYKLWEYYKKQKDWTKIDELRQKLRGITPECGSSRYLPQKALVNETIELNEDMVITYLGSSYVKDCLYITDEVPFLHIFQKVEKRNENKSELSLIRDKGSTRLYEFEDKLFSVGIARNMI
ncbi:O-antigen ligase family protein, partial [bacterium]|nr:O-antigen ligase family protein [bacterium]